MNHRDSDWCVICGTRRAETRDHVPPKNIFPKPRPSDLLTVPACFQCNNRDSEEDEDFRTYLSVQIGHESEITKKLWQEGAVKSLMRRTATRKKLLESIAPIRVDVYGNGEEFLRFKAPIPVYDVVFTRIVKGLYFHHTGKILGSDVSISISPLYGIADEAVPHIDCLPTQSIGSGAFIYKYGISIDDDRYSVWVCQFYHLHWVLMRTEPINA